MKMKPWQLRNNFGEPISPITRIDTIMDENGPIKPRYDKIKEMLDKIVGPNGHEGPYTWDELQEIVQYLLIEYNLSPIHIAETLPPTSERDANKLYIRYKTPFQTGEYGVRVDMEKGTVTRIGDNAGKTLEDFYNILPWAGRRRCHMVGETQEFVSYYGDKNYDPDDNYHVTLVESPMFYYKRVPIKIGDNKELLIFEDWISYNPKEGYSVHPAFIRDGQVVDNIYIGAYEAFINYRGNISSHPDLYPTRNKTIEQFREACFDGFQLFDIQTLSAEQMLLLISTASFDSQSVIGSGVSDGDTVLTGATKNMGSKCGSAGEDGTPVNFFGVENLWGNHMCVVDNISVGDTIRIGEDELSFRVVNTLSDNRDIGAFGYDNELDYLYIPVNYDSDKNMSGDSCIFDIDTNGSYSIYNSGGKCGEREKCGIFSSFSSATVEKSANIVARIIHFRKK